MQATSNAQGSFITEDFQFADQYSLNKLVFVNSAFHCFTELDINQHLAIFGRNNKGKTSILNALKLFLLPEENFNKCESKFKFAQPNGGYYKALESFHHYFTDDRSFLILEAENRYGKFCQILYRTRSAINGYGRLLLPQPFSSIRKLFWCEESAKNGGLGEIVADLSLKNILKQLHTMGAKSLSGHSAICEALFQENGYDSDAGRYCILPFAKQNMERALDAFSTLFQLLYDISAKDKQTLPRAVAAVLESGKQYARDRLNVDFSEILQQFSRLKAERCALQRCFEYQSKWQVLQSIQHKFSQQTEQNWLKWHQFNHQLTQEQAQFSQQKKAREAQNQQLCAEFNQAKRRWMRCKTDCDQQNGQLTVLQQNYQKEQRKLEEINLICQGYPHQTKAEIITRLQQEKTALSERLNQLSDANKAQQDFQKINHAINQTKQDIAILEAQLNNKRASFLHSLQNTKAREVLFSLNKHFASLHCQPTAEEAQTIAAFSQLFQVQETMQPPQLQFLGETLPNTPFTPYDPNAILRQWQQELTQKQAELSALDAALMKLREILQSNQNISALSQQTRQQLNDVEVQLKLLLNFDDIRERYETEKKAWQQADEKRNVLKASLVETEQAYQLAQARYNEDCEKLVQWLQQYAQYPRFQSRLNHCHANLMALSPLFTNNMTNFPAITLDDEQLTAFEKSLMQWQEDAKAREKLLRELLNAQLLGEEAELSANFIQLDETLFQHAYRALGDLYLNLENEWQSLQQRIAQHAKYSAIQMQAIEDAQLQISTFEKELNQAFARHQISDLAEIRLVFKLHPNFQQLVSELKQIDRATETLHSDRFYLLLAEFSHQFFGSEGKGSLEMAHIICEVSYECRKHGEEKLSKTGQSTGTSTMINCLLLSALLQRLMRRNTRLTLPLVLDEMEKIDLVNLPEFIRIAEHYGFAVFGTCPDPSPKVINAVGNYINLEYFSAEQPYHPRNRILYLGQAESLLSTQNENQRAVQ